MRVDMHMVYVDTLFLGLSRLLVCVHGYTDPNESNKPNSAFMRRSSPDSFQATPLAGQLLPAAGTSYCQLSSINRFPEDATLNISRTKLYSALVMSDTTANKATEVFSVPELLELILLSLPSSNVHQEISSLRTILLARTTCPTWHTLVETSTPLRQFLYLSSAADKHSSPRAWHQKHAYAPSRPNSWIPILVLERRSWGFACPFQPVLDMLDAGKSRYWTFSLEISARQYQSLLRLDTTQSWASLLAAEPPFAEFWYTRCFYELGSGRAPIVTYVDYESGKPPWQQKYFKHRAAGITLGDLVEASKELFEIEGPEQTKYVMVESVRVPLERKARECLVGDLALSRHCA